MNKKYTLDEAEANARLIAAAAPDLYHALKAAVSNLRMAQINPDAFGEETAEYKAAQAAWDSDIAACDAALAKCTE